MTARRLSPALLVIFALVTMPWTAMAQQTSINWMSLEEAVAAQQDEPRKIMMDVYTQWCGPCKMMMRNTFTNADVISYINANYYAVKFDAESPGPVTNAYPTLVYFDENATVITPIAGYKTPQQLELYLRFFAEEYSNGVQQEQWEKFRDSFAPSFQ